MSRQETAQRLGFFRNSDGQYEGLFSQERCQRIAQKLLTKYDRNKDGVIDNIEIREMMSDTYKSMGRNFQPTATDIVEYTKVIAQTNSEKSKISQSDITSYITKIYGTSGFSDKQSELNFGQSMQTKPFTNCNYEFYQALENARKIFEEFQQEDRIQEKDLRQIIEKSFLSIEKQYSPTEQDIKSLIDSLDRRSRPGSLPLSEFQVLIIKAFSNQKIVFK